MTIWSCSPHSVSAHLAGVAMKENRPLFGGAAPKQSCMVLTVNVSRETEKKTEERDGTMLFYFIVTFYCFGDLNSQASIR